MSVVIFYEKPGCSTNAKQKKSLQEAGCMLIEKDLLHNGLTKEELLAFLAPHPVAHWFNPNAPKIKNKEINPARLDAAAALELLMQEPILIRRPLLVIQGEKLLGFDQERIEALIGEGLKQQVDNRCSGSEEACTTPKPRFSLKP